MNRRAAEERLRLEGVATPDITSAARYATLPKMGTRDVSRAGQRCCPRLMPMGTRVVVHGPGSSRETPLGENGGDAVRAPRRIAPHHRRHCRSPLPPSFSFFLRLHLPLVYVLLEIPAERPASPNLDINAGSRHCSYLLFVCCSSSRDNLF